MVAAFTGAWYFLAGHLTAWSDEVSHMSVAKGFNLTGEPFVVAFDQCAQLLSAQYVRGLEVSQMTAWSFEAFGDSLTSARLVPFLFTIASWLLYAGYVKIRHDTSGRHLAVATVLFLGQAMVLEKALYVRVYAPLLFFLLLSLIGLWEAVVHWQARNLRFALLWLAVAIFSLVFTRGWHLLQYSIFVLAVLFLVMLIRGISVRDLARGGWHYVATLPPVRKYPAILLLVGVLAAVMVVGPQAINSLGSELLGLDKAHSTSWDNFFGLLRFLLATNVLLLIWWMRSGEAEPRRDFHSWLVDAGLVSGVLVALLMNHNFVFWSRFFYLSVALVALGVSPRVAGLANMRALGGVLVTYVLINGIFSGLNLYLDRSNIKDGIAWLRLNSGEGDIILAYGAELYLHGGRELCSRTVPVVKSEPLGSGTEIHRNRFLFSGNTYPFIGGDELISVLNSKPQGEVYFLYTDAHRPRETLFRWTTGRSRDQRNDLYGLVMGRPGRSSSDDLFRLLKNGDVGEEVLPGLRGAGLERIDREGLFAALESRTFP